MMNMLVDNNLNRYIMDNGGINDVLYNGRKTTKEMFFSLNFDGGKSYNLTLEVAAAGNGVTVKESHKDENFKSIYDKIAYWRIYHFHDTSSTADMRHEWNKLDTKYLRSDASNIAPYLLHLREWHPLEYKAILNACRAVMPYLNDFLLDETLYRDGLQSKIRLSWQSEKSKLPMEPYQMSDGSIRFVCLATALLQPTLPPLLIIDEPELGLHPEAICVLGGLIKSASERTQIIIATQSPSLIDQFDIEDIVVVNRRDMINRKDDQSLFNRLNKDDFDVWLEEYSVGELWEKNVIQGGICYE
jgi:predicted ATPase